MKLYALPPTDSIALKRISGALIKNAPKEVIFVNSKEEADLVIFFAYGRRDHLKLEIEEIKKNNKKYAIIQISVRSTRNPLTSDWMDIWKNAVVVWSYFDLNLYCKEDGIKPYFNFYHAPLGVDEVFKKVNVPKKYVIASSGLGYTVESTRECILAAAEVGKRVFHVGPIIATHRPEVDFSNGMTDGDLCKNYSACEFVSGLRRGEGFELPVLEGLVCGARPIVFDKPHYKKWFKDYAVFIPETSRDGIVENLIKVFQKGPKKVTKKETNEVKKKFAWKPIVKGFWKEII